jgi:hypothetical protein
LRRRAEALASQVRYLELSGRPDFTDAYMEEMMLPTLDDLEL